MARPVILALKRWSLRSCTAVVVTNPENRQFAGQRLGVHAFVLPDPLPKVPIRAARAGNVTLYPGVQMAPVVFVCSFAKDEPLELMEATGALLRSEVSIAFTGDSRGLSQKMRARLSAVGQLTGFLPDTAYWELLRMAETIIVLTTEPACLPCGAYEAIAVGRRPILLADERALAVFGELAIFAYPEATNLASAIKTGCGSAGRLRPQDVAKYERRWQSWWNDLPGRLRPCEI